MGMVHAALLAVLLLALPLQVLASGSRPRMGEWAVPVPSNSFVNLFKVDDRLYRSEQPDRAGMHQVASLGVKRVLNLRHGIEDDCKAIGDLDLELVHLPMTAYKLEDEKIAQALRAILASEEPILVHCRHGADRTGAVIAVYRMVVNGWSKTEAMAEMKKGGFGFYGFMFPNIPRYLEELDVEEMKKRVFGPTQERPSRAGEGRPALQGTGPCP